jgi:aldehyde dehydrogenase (NAD+)
MVLDEQTKTELVKHLKAAVAKFFPKGSGDYGKMVNERHFDRVKSLLDEGKGKVEFGGQCDRASLTIEPTVITDAPRNCKLMSEEIFGPVLAIFTVKSLDEAISYINAGEKPLALYVFTGDKTVADRVIKETSSGAVVVNDTMVHALVDTLPFGGVGHSGIGAYHGKHSFEAFSHKKAVVRKDLRLEIANELRYPPYSATKLKWIKWVLGFPHAPKPEGIWAHANLIALVALLFGVIAYVTRS